MREIPQIIVKKLSDFELTWRNKLAKIPPREMASCVVCGVQMDCLTVLHSPNPIVLESIRRAERQKKRGVYLCTVVTTNGKKDTMNNAKRDNREKLVIKTEEVLALAKVRKSDFKICKQSELDSFYKPCEEAKQKQESEEINGTIYRYAVWVIELPTMKELKSFVEKYKRVVINQQSNGQFCMTIADDYLD